jgi:hypothetical protein
MLLSRTGGAAKRVAVLDAVQDGFGQLVVRRLNSEMRDTVRQTTPRYQATGSRPRRSDCRRFAIRWWR